MNAVVLVLGFGLAFAESGLGVGMFVPGETAVVVLAATVPSTLGAVLLALAVALGASAGDHVGFLLGRRYGDALRESRAVRRLGQEHFDRATGLVRRRGGTAVFLTRLVPVVRTLMPAAAGASGLEYRSFAPASLAGSLTWSAAYVGGGSIVAGLAHLASQVLGGASWIVLLLAALLALTVWLLRAVGGGRPVAAAPDAVAIERATGARHRRAPWSPLIGDVQRRRADLRARAGRPSSRSMASSAEVSGWTRSAAVPPVAPRHGRRAAVGSLPVARPAPRGSARMGSRRRRARAPSA